MGAVGDGAGDELELLAGVALVVDLRVARLKLRFLDDGSAFTVRDRNVDCRIVSKNEDRRMIRDSARKFAGIRTACCAHLS